MAPVLFLFLMQAMSESLKKRNLEGTSSTVFCKHEDDPQEGRVAIEPKPEQSGKGKIFDILHTLFVDDVAALFDSLEELRTGAAELHQHFDASAYSCMSVLKILTALGKIKN